MAGLAAARMSGGSEFHAAGPARKKARSPNLVRRGGVTYMYLLLEADRNILINNIWTLSSLISGCSSEADVVFVLDASGSLDEANFIHVKNFVSNVVSELDVDNGKIRVGVVTYSDYAEPRFNLIQYNTRYAFNTFQFY